MLLNEVGPWGGEYPARVKSGSPRYGVDLPWCVAWLPTIAPYCATRAGLRACARGSLFGALTWRTFLEAMPRLHDVLSLPFQVTPLLWLLGRRKPSPQRGQSHVRLSCSSHRPLTISSGHWLRSPAK